MNDVIPIHPVHKTTIGETKILGIKITPENKCSYCRGSTCCTYVTQALDTPRGMDDFDVLLWQIAHPNVEVYKDEDGWFLMFTGSSCTYLLPGGRCGIYERRPQICRDHDNDGCEFEGPAGHDDFELYFQTFESLDEWCRKKFKGWDRRFASNELKNKKKNPKSRTKADTGRKARKRA